MCPLAAPPSPLPETRKYAEARACQALSRVYAAGGVRAPLSPSPSASSRITLFSSPSADLRSPRLSVGLSLALLVVCAALRHLRVSACVCACLCTMTCTSFPSSVVCRAVGADLGPALTLPLFPSLSVVVLQTPPWVSLYASSSSSPLPRSERALVRARVRVEVQLVRYCATCARGWACL